MFYALGFLAQAGHEAKPGGLPEIDIMPHRIHLGGMEIGSSVLVGWLVTALLVLLLLCLRGRIRRFADKPKGLQNFLEMIVESVYNFARGKVGHNADFVAPMVLTLMGYVAVATLVELFGLPPATEDLSCTLALGLTTFVLVNVTALRQFGLKTRIRRLASPNAMVLPIRILTDCVAPISMALRLFANVLVGGIIMKLIYAVMPYVLPAVLSVYFNLIHVAIQTFVFGMLTLNYISEATE
ncbi:MAG: F0F1 ATP synthase subunit A [Oscillospiraceae bacterium]|jgi:F-type H+-transporting ATPase subunit a|nr:F0F1 ATP synthase subunit A [Oscillospiraceae bacterium]